MSHFLTIVLMPRTTRDASAEITRLLAPYDENLDVPPYSTKCYCVGSAARIAASATADRKEGTYADLRASFHARITASAPLTDEAADEAAEVLWKEHVAARQKAEAEALAAQPNKNEPAPTCEECHGSGEYMTTRNPNGKWDYWRVGGRWDGVIQGAPRESENGFNFGKDHENIGNNFEFAGTIALQEPPFAIVTPDGQWHARGRMGWFAVVADEKDDWPGTARALFEAHADCIGVACDLHT